MADNGEMEARLREMAGVCRKAEGIVKNVRERMKGHGHKNKEGENP